MRVHRLAAPATFAETRRYQGCVSWVALDEPVDVTGATPVLDDAAFDARVAVLREALGAPDARD